MYGYRARIGYTSPPATTEVFPYEFYKIVPDGVTLVINTLPLVNRTSDEVDRAYDVSLNAAHAMARAGVDIFVFGGLPINASRGFGNAADMAAETEKEIGVPVITSLSAQQDAFAAVGARQVCRQHPQSDTLYIPCPHFATAGVIDPLEREFDITVITALQAIVWRALRRCGIDDRIDGFGRLFREF